MEHGFLKAPWEVLVRNFRAGHKPLAKEMELFSSSIAHLVHQVSAAPSPAPVPPLSIAHLETKLTGLKRKLEAVRAADEDAMNRCHARIHHLCTRAAPQVGPDDHLDEEHMDVDAEETSPDLGTSTVERQKETAARWEKVKLDRALVDYMLREGMYDTAERLAKAQRLELVVDTKIFRESRVVIEALRKRDCSEGLRWCAENKRRLQKVQSKLEFRLRLQEFVEHARAGRKHDAIAYMQKYLSVGNCDQERMCDIQRFMALLVYDPTTACQPYKDLYSERKWTELELAFKRDNYRLHGLTRESTVEIMVKAGLASLKTRKCGTEADRKPNCPTCVEPYLSLAQALPRARHEHSILVCSISGDIMDENNPPLAFPNGNVYSTKALNKISEENDGVFIDPKTKDRASPGEMRKCFIM